MLRGFAQDTVQYECTIQRTDGQGTGWVAVPPPFSTWLRTVVGDTMRHTDILLHSCRLVENTQNRPCRRAADGSAGLPVRSGRSPTPFSPPPHGVLVHRL